MNKMDVVNWLQEEYRQWQALLAEIGPARMEQPGVAAHWSMKDIIAHLTGWNRRLVASLQAALRGEPEPPPPWPANLEEDDDVNAWIYESYRKRSLDEILDEMGQVHQALVTTIESLPDDIRIEWIEPAFYLVWVGDRRFVASEFFNHFHDDHEPDIRAWLARAEKE